MTVLDFLTHRTITSSGHQLHFVETGASQQENGPLVIMIHGFPESWYSWRHQLTALSATGYRAVASSVRGYGRSAQPAAIEAYSMTALVGDIVAIIDEFNVDKAIIVGHDWGAAIAWNTALLRPDRVAGVAGFSLPYHPRSNVKPLEKIRASSRDEMFYVDYFQQPGLVEAEVEKDLAGWLQGFYFTASGEADPTKPSMGFVAKGKELRDRLQQPKPGQMAWLTEADLAFYVEEFERTGLTGGFNRYRNFERDWTDLAPWHHAPIRVPALFIGGDKDGTTSLGKRAIARFDKTLPKLTKSKILSNCGHWVQQEKPDEVNLLLTEFCSGLS